MATVTIQNQGTTVYHAYGRTYTNTATATNVSGTPSYAWTLVSKPSGSSATLTNGTTQTVTLDYDVPGTYIIECSVTDSGGTVISGRTTIVVRAVESVRIAGQPKAAAINVKVPS